MYSPQKLHPVAYLGSVASGIKNLWLPIILILFNQRETIFSGNISLRWFLIVGGIFLLLLIIFGAGDFINKYRTRFWIEDKKFILKDGVFTRREKELDVGRIQSIDFNEPVLHRLFGAVKLEIKTPGEGITIDTIKKAQAEELQSILYKEKDRINEGSDSVVTDVEIGDSSPWPKEEEPETSKKEFNILYKMSGKELLLMAMTSGALGSFIAIVFAFLNLIGATFLIEVYLEYFENVFQSLAIGLTIAILFFVAAGYVIGILILLIKYYNYTLKNHHDDLAVEYGLLEKKHKSVNINRVQNIVIKDSLLRRLIGYYSLSVTITSEDFSKDNANGSVVLLPFIKKNEIYNIIQEIFPNYHVEQPDKIVPRRGYRRYFQIMTAIFIIVTAVVQYFWWSYAWIVGLVLILVTVLSGIYSARNNGYKINGEEINVLSTAFFTRSHFVIKHDKVIGAKINENPLLIRAKLANISVTTAAGAAGSSATIHYIDRKDIDKVWHWAERGMQNEENITESN